jgi:hypothetical protein
VSQTLEKGEEVRLLSWQQAELPPVGCRVQLAAVAAAATKQGSSQRSHPAALSATIPDACMRTRSSFCWHSKRGWSLLHTNTRTAHPHCPPPLPPLQAVYIAFGGSTIVVLFQRGAVRWDEDLARHRWAGLDACTSTCWANAGLEVWLGRRMLWGEVVGGSRS